MQTKLAFYIMLPVIVFCFGCKGSPGKPKAAVYKGVCSFGPEIRSFKDCDNGREFWISDSSKQLEPQYAKLNFEKPYEPVYVELVGLKVRSGKEGLGAEYDSTLIVRKVLLVNKQIPLDRCN